MVPSHETELTLKTFPVKQSLTASTYSCNHSEAVGGGSSWIGALSYPFFAFSRARVLPSLGV
jgi:hypothetical protein